jgi:formate dehydrogenase major subunit
VDHQQMARAGAGLGTTRATPRGAVFDEMRRLMPSIAGITWARLQREGA